MAVVVHLDGSVDAEQHFRFPAATVFPVDHQGDVLLTKAQDLLREIEPLT